VNESKSLLNLLVRDPGVRGSNPLPDQCFLFNGYATIPQMNPSAEILHHHDPFIVLVHLRVQNRFSVGRHSQALRLAVEGRD
jgi:hypothetical protein